MARRATLVLAAALLCLTPVAGHAALSSYLGTFEGMGIGEIGAPNSLSTDGWLVYGNVFNGTVWLYGYGPYPAPNDGAAFCAVTTGQGGDLQGLNQLSVYSDYNNQGAHTAGYLVEANVYHEQTVAAADVGNTWTLQFDAKLGNLVSPTTAVAFIKTIDPNNGWQMTNFITVNTTAIPATWNTYTISIPVDRRPRRPVHAVRLRQHGDEQQRVRRLLRQRGLDTRRPAPASATGRWRAGSRSARPRRTRSSAPPASPSPCRSAATPTSRSST